MEILRDIKILIIISFHLLILKEIILIQQEIYYVHLKNIIQL